MKLFIKSVFAMVYIFSLGAEASAENALSWPEAHNLEGQVDPLPSSDKEKEKKEVQMPLPTSLKTLPKTPPVNPPSEEGQ